MSVYGLSMETVPLYKLSSFRYFSPNEKHITRYEKDDVLLLVMSGVLRFTEDGVPVEVCPGEYYIQEAGLFQSGQVPSDCPAYFYIHFRGTWADGPRVLPRRGLYEPGSLLPLARQLDTAQKSRATAIEKNALLTAILSQLFLHTGADEASRLMSAAALRLTADLKNPPSLDELARQSFISQEYLIRLFRREIGMTPHRYLTASRIDQAKILLKTSDATAEQIGLECGFSDYPHFYRAFLKSCGMTPAAYRRLKREGGAGEERRTPQAPAGLTDTPRGEAGP